MLQSQNKDFVYEGDDVTTDGTIGPNTKHPATGEALGDSWVSLATLVRFNMHRGMNAQEAFDAAVSDGENEEVAGEASETTTVE